MSTTDHLVTAVRSARSSRAARHPDRERRPDLAARSHVGWERGVAAAWPVNGRENAHQGGREALWAEALLCR